MTAEKFTPRPEQEVAIDLALAQVGTSNGCLVGDEPGFGKTLIGTEIALRGVERHGWSRVLFIALPNTHAQWKERIEAQMQGRGPFPEVLVMNGTKAGKAAHERFLAREPGIYIAGSAYLRAQDWGREQGLDERGQLAWQADKDTGELLLDEDGNPKPKLVSKQLNTYRRRFAKHPLDAVIFDECQEIANRKSATRRTIYSIKAEFRVAMSGTWFLNAIENMWSIARWVWPGENPATGGSYVESAFSRWVDRFLEQAVVRKDNGEAVTTTRGNDVMKTVGEKIPGEFVSTLPAYIRRENDDKVPDAEVVLVPPTIEQARQIAELQRDLMTWVQGWDGEQAPLVIDIPMVLRMRLRQVAIAELSLDEKDGEEVVSFDIDAKSAKLSAVAGILEGPWAGQPVAIYTDSKIGAKFLEARMRRAGKDARAWTGDLTMKQREELKRAFMAGEFPYLIATVQSFGTGIDGLQRVCSKVIWVSEADGNPAINDQAIARFFRPGRTKQYGDFQHVKLLMDGSVDVSGFEALIAKAWSIRTAMNGGIAA